MRQNIGTTFKDMICLEVVFVMPAGTINWFKNIEKGAINKMQNTPKGAIN